MKEDKLKDGYEPFVMLLNVCFKLLKIPTLARQLTLSTSTEINNRTLDSIDRVNVETSCKTQYKKQKESKN